MADRGVAAIVTVGATLLAARLADQSMWLDEGLTMLPALRATTLAELVSRVREWDSQPPLSHAITFFLRDFFPQSDFWLRLPSLVFVESGLLVLYWTLAALWGRGVALLTVALAQFSPLLASYAAEARNYGLWFFLVAASFFLMLRCVRAHFPSGAGDPGRPAITAAAWGLINGLGLWTHLFHLFVIAGQLAMVLASLVWSPAKYRQAWRSVTGFASLALVVSALIFLPWLSVMTSAENPIAAGVGWTRDFRWVQLGYYAFASHAGASFGPSLRDLHVQPLAALVRANLLSLAIAAIVMTSTAYTYWRLLTCALTDRAHRWELLALAVFPGAALVGPLAYAATTDFPLHIRHFLFVWPLLPLVVALGCRRYPFGRWSYAAFAGLQLIALGNLLFNDYYAKDDERGAISFAERESTAGYVFADTAPHYCTKLEGRQRTTSQLDAAVTTAARGSTIWLVHNRTWEGRAQVFRRRLEERLSAKGILPAASYTQFNGVTLLRYSSPVKPEPQ